ncbi:SNF2-related protein [Photobacterium damselae]|uniref:SNF2-related protein n=1 Tax=Photobacterium damselae TaxID=38293 RepID=UPI001EED25AE|nr:SNF2-related protein [Photobacterium damselae]UKA12810.1 SNF2-related protein [Photobacterium damselae subsp. damselae]
MNTDKLSQLTEQVQACVTLEELLNVFDRNLLKKYGVTADKISLSAAKKLRQEANKQAKSILQRVGNDPEALTSEDKEILRSYTGGGGLGEDTMNEYYTPQFVAQGIWDGMVEMGFSGGNTLEPSAGAGVFAGTKPPATEMTSVELDQTSGTINQLLNPSDTVHISNFEKIASVTDDESFDSVVGNPPFGDRGEFALDDPEYGHINVADKYFVERSIKLCKAGGLIAMALPPRIVDRASWADWRKSLSYQAEFLGAHMLPAGTFNANGTGTTVIVAFWRKHGKEITQQLENIEEQALYDSGVLFDDYISGKYFERSGKKYVHGELEYKKGQFDSIETTAKGKVEPSAIRKKLAKPFHSRIDWSVLDVAPPIADKYSEGDQRQINGRLKELKNGVWVEADVVGQKGNSLDKNTYGVSTIDDLRNLGFGDYLLSNTTLAQAKAINSNFKALISQPNQAALDFILAQKDKYQEQIMSGTAIGLLLQKYRGIRMQGRDDPTLRDEIINKAQAQFLKFGHPHQTKALIGLKGKESALWNDFCEALDKDGNPSAFLQNEIDTADNQAYDSSNPSSVIGYLYNTIGNREITIDDINEFSDDAIDMSYVLADKSICIDANGFISPIESFCSGDIVKKRDSLIAAIGKASKQGKKKNADLIDKWQNQLDQIKAKRAAKWQSLDDVKVSLNAPWIPKDLILDFLADSGYSEFKLGGDRVIDPKDNKAGDFWGYRYTEEGKKLSKTDEQFHRHLENYLNGQAVDGKGTTKAEVMKDINALNESFSDWVISSTRSDELEQKYNDTYNRYLEFSHSNKDLELNNVSGDITLMPYQNEAIRRMAEDGRGLLGFQMGLGKTFTALGLAAYNLQTNRFKRTCIVVPKSTYENWYHEHTSFFGHANQKGTLFIGLEPIMKGGEIEQTPILDKNGEPTGKYRDRVKELSSSEIAANMAKIPHSNYQMVVMTKEQFSKIPMRPQTKDEYVSKMVDNQNIRSVRLAMDTVLGTDTSKMKDLDTKSGYANAKKQASFRKRYSDEGTDKSGAYPFFEDMLFDNVIVDEAHNYRNSYQAGREASKLAWLPTQGSAKTSLDMTLKLDHIKSQNNGEGSYLLTATPNVNSPTDIFNMLSLVIGADEWMEKYNIANVDDFIKVFGDVEVRDIEKLSGEIEGKEALVGFNNLGGLQNLFHRWCNLKDADDVGADVEIPDIEDIDTVSPMSSHQADIYEELRQQADMISKATTEEEKEALREKGITVFGIIRKMDKVATDIDLYNGTITYLFNSDDESKVKALVDKLPKSLKVTDIDDDKELDLGDGEKAETFNVGHNAKITNDGEYCKLVVNAAYEDKVQSLLKRNGIDEATVTHPITGKYAQLIENVKNGLKDGKQIIFTEEKTQHNKLKRILCYHLGIKPNQIGIINADAIKNAQGDDELAGLEAIAADYNEGRKQIVIANKKAEVGINLHHGTTDIHHLTIPWTPASLRQRNGRGARVGSTAKKVRSWIYSAKGSFDKFRYQTMQRKANWINEVLTTTSNSAGNANADDMALANDLLAKDEATRLQQQAERQAEAERKQKAEAQKRANKQLEVYISNCHLANINEEETKRQIAEIDFRLEKERETMAKVNSRTDAYKNAATNVRAFNDRKRRLVRAQAAQANAQNKVKQLRPIIERYINNGTLSVEPSILDKADQYVMFNGRLIENGSTWSVIGSKKEMKRELNGSYGTSESNDISNVSIAARSDGQQKLIVRVSKQHQDQGFAECRILWPYELSIYSGSKSLQDGGTTAVFYDSFIEPVNFERADLIEKNLTHTLSSSISRVIRTENDKRVSATPIPFDVANEAAKSMGMERFNKVMEENGAFVNVMKTQDAYGNYGRYTQQVPTEQICYKNGEFVIVDPTNIPEGFERSTLMPQMMTEDLTAKLGAWALTFLIEKDALSSRYSAESVLPAHQLDELLGKGWFNNIESYGESIPESELCEFANTAIDKYRNFDWDQAAQVEYDEENKKRYNRSEHNAISRVVTAYEKHVKDHYYSLIDEKYLNKKLQSQVINSAIGATNNRTTATEAYKAVQARVKAEKEAAEQEKMDLVTSTYETWKAKADMDSAKERLNSVGQVLINESYNVAAARDKLYDLDKENEILSLSDQLLLKMSADLTLFKDFDDIDFAYWSYSSSNQVSKFTRALQKGIDPLITPTQEVSEDDEKMINAPMSDDELDLDDPLTEMIVKINQSEIVVPARSIKKGRYKKTITQPARTIPAKTVIGIQDPDGYKGRLSELFKGRTNPVKAKYHAEWFDRDDADELSGGWWIIPADTDLDELSKEFDNL